MSEQARKSSTRTAMALMAVVLVMGAMSFAAVPLYNMFCRVTGWGGVTNRADAGSEVVLDRTVKIRFDASKERGMPWEFHPAAHEMELKIGETGLAFFTAHNPTDRVIAGTASYNVTPFSAGVYFTKIECFCFSEQVLQPGQTIEMPVTFYVDPDIVNDEEASLVETITLSYTMHETELPDAVADAGARSGGDKGEAALN
jgi:cytochrome c oxidase assembly protein subunit 11